MNILIICDLQPMGGSVTYVTNLVTTLLAERHSVTLVSFSETPFQIFPSHPKFVYIELLIKKRYKKSSLLQRITRLLKTLKSLDPKSFDCILTDYYLSGISFIFSALLIGNWNTIPLFYQFHGSAAIEQKYTTLGVLDIFYNYSYLINKTIENICYAHSKKILCFSKYSMHILTSTFHYPEKITHIHPGREILFDEIFNTFTKDQARDFLQISKTAFVIFIASRIEKGVYEIVEKLHENSELFSNTMIVIATNIKDIRCPERLEGAVPLKLVNLPSRHDIALLYRTADLTVMPSQKLETFGLSTLESYCEGTPVIAYDIGANSELIQKEYLASVISDQSLIDTIMSYKNTTESEKKQIADTCKIRSGEYSWETYIQKLCSMINQTSSIQR